MPDFAEEEKYCIMMQFQRLHFMLLFIFRIIHSVYADCEFPSYLARASVWTADYKDKGSLTVVFKRNIMDALHCPHPDESCVNYEQECKDETEEGKYVVEYKTKGRDSTNNYPEYLCIQFIQRSEYIIQFKTTLLRLAHRSPELCSEENLVLDHWPLFAPKMVESVPVQCPLNGGYNMQIRGPEGEVCPGKLVLPRIESECETGDGITFDFRYNECVHPDLKMKKLQHLVCVTSWDHVQYTFVILRPRAQEFEAWCMRITKSGNNEVKDIVLFMDSVCDPGSGNSHNQITETTNFLSISLDKIIVASVCANEFEGCNVAQFCESSIRDYCYRSCKQCKPEVELCSFPEDEMGVWLMESSQGISRINISAYELNIPQIGKFQCLARNVSNNENRTALLHVFDNGCFPRFACMEMIRSSTYVRQFRLGNRVNWPQFPIENIKKNTCKKTKFKTQMLIGNEERTVPIPLNVLMLESSNFHYSTSCNLPESLGFKNHALYFQEGNQCSGCLLHDPVRSRYKIEIVTVNCTKKLQRIKLICLASFQFDQDTRAVITGTDYGDDRKLKEFLCWVFTRYGKQRRLITLRPADCHNVAKEITLENSPGGPQPMIAMFDIKEPPPDTSCPPINYFPSKVAKQPVKISTTTLHYGINSKIYTESVKGNEFIPLLTTPSTLRPPGSLNVRSAGYKVYVIWSWEIVMPLLLFKTIAGAIL